MSSVHPFVKGKFYLKIIGRFAQKVLILVIFPPFPSNFAYRTYIVTFVGINRACMRMEWAKRRRRRYLKALTRDVLRVY